ncbi:MAG: hypothetical protein JOZ73_09190 [Solirubrobacterales bacterium]|nr:hypothetical protein [Solirubrobacterales bacterium]
MFAVGSTDRLFFRLHISYPGQIHFWRVGIWVLPITVFFLTRAICRSLQSSESHPLREWQGAVVRQRADGSIEPLLDSPDRVSEPDTEEPVGTVPGSERNP